MSSNFRFPFLTGPVWTGLGQYFTFGFSVAASVAVVTSVTTSSFFSTSETASSSAESDPWHTILQLNPSRPKRLPNRPPLLKSEFFLLLGSSHGERKKLS